MKSMPSPLDGFLVKMNNDLAGWVQRECHAKQLLQDYQNTLASLGNPIQPTKLLVSLGADVYIKAKKTDHKIIIRCTETLYMEFNPEEAKAVLGSLIQLYTDKLRMCKQEMVKIMVAMREIEYLIQEYSNIA